MIEQIGLKPALPALIQGKSAADTGAADITRQFSSFLQDALNNVATQEQQSAQLNESFIKGDITDVHQVMVAAEKASLGLSLTVQTRNKIIEAYQEIMRTQL